MTTKIEVEQAEITVGKHDMVVTNIPTATSESWYVVHDACEIWGAVALDTQTGEVIGWRNGPQTGQCEIEQAIRTAFGIPNPAAGTGGDHWQTITK